MQSKELYISCSVRIRSNLGGSVILSGVEGYDSGLSSDYQSLTDIYRKLNINHPKFFKMDTQCKLGFLGSYFLLDDFRAELQQNDEAVSLLFANRSSSLKTDLEYQVTVGRSGTGSPAKFVYTLPNIVIGEICIYWKQYGETQFLVLPAFDAEVLLKHAQIMMSVTNAEHVLVGWTEVSTKDAKSGAKNDNSPLRAGGGLDGLFVLLSKNGKQLATVSELSQLYGN